MTPLSDTSKVTQCRICSITVPVADLPDHLLADAKMLRVIKTTRPEWSRQECEEHLRALCVSHPSRIGELTVPNHPALPPRR